MRKNNLWNVIRFEIVRNLKKPSFWIAALLVPFLIIGYTLLVSFIGSNAEQSVGQGSDTSNMSLGIYDEADYVVTNQFINLNDDMQELTEYDSKEQGINDVKSGELDVFYHLPADFSENLVVETYSKPDTSSILNDYTAPIRALLTVSATSNINPTDLAVVTNNVSFETTNFSTEDNSEIDVNKIISKMIVPIAGAALFLMLVMMFGNRLTSAMVEEKENRISEIILTSIKPSDLIIGKIVSLIVLGIIQIGILIIPLLLMYIFGSSQNIIPADIVVSFDPYIVTSTILLLVSSYFLFSAMCIIVGTLVPTAKDAASFSGIQIILVILPLMTINLFMSDSPNLLVYIMSYFPPTAPMALMLRSAFGTLPVWEMIIGIIDIVLFSFLAVKFAVYVFSRSAIEFTSKINLKSLYKNQKKS